MKKLSGFALGLSSSILAGCLAASGTSGDGKDLFPKPVGEQIIPIEFQSANSKFRYVELDDSGAVAMRLTLTLTITNRGDNLFGYAFQTPDQGHLLKWSDGGGNRDSAGIYIVGTFDQFTNFFDPKPALWLPQFPKTGSKWALDSLRSMELVSADTALFTEPIYSSSGTQAGNDSTSYGFQRHSTLLFREIAGDTVTYYHFSRGIGCLAFERSVKGRLSAAGTIFSFYGAPSF